MFQMNIFRVVAAAFLVLMSAAFGNTDDSDGESFQRYSLVPVLGYTEETEFQIGAMALFFLKPDFDGGKVPEIGLTAYGSTREQLQLVLEPYFYFSMTRLPSGACSSTKTGLPAISGGATIRT